MNEENRLTSPSYMKYIIDKYKFHTNKNLGQNFLIDNNILDKIIITAGVSDKDTVLEIGTGIGTLTNELLKHSNRVIAVEIDKNLCPIVRENVSELKKLTLMNEDFLKTDLSSFKIDKIVANLPYYITTPIIFKCLTLNADKMVFLVQKEAALRLTAKPGTKSYGSLTVALQSVSEVKYVHSVSAACFFPKPDVDSAIIEITRYDKIKYNIKNLKIFELVNRGAFAKRRKTILNSLTGYSPEFTKDLVKQALLLCKIDEKRRGETLDINEISELSNTIFDLINGEKNE